MAKEELKKANEKEYQVNEQELKDKIFEVAKALFLEIYPIEIELRKSRKNSWSAFNRVFSKIAKERGKKVDLDKLHRIVSKDIFLKDICFRPEDDVVAVREIENASKGSIDANEIAVILSDGEYAPLDDYYTLWVLGIDKSYYVCDEKVELSYRYDEIEDIVYGKPTAVAVEIKTTLAAKSIVIDPSTVDDYYAKNVYTEGQKPDAPAPDDKPVTSPDTSDALSALIGVLVLADAALICYCLKKKK